MSNDEDQLRSLFGRLADRQTVHSTDGVWLTERFRRRRARQGVAAAAATVCGVVAVAVIIAVPHDGGRATVVTEPVSPAPSPTAESTATPTTQASPPTAPVPPRLTAATGTRLVVVQGTRLELLDTDTGRRTLLATDRRLLGNDRIDVAVVEGELVLLANNNTGAGNGPNEVLATTAGPGSALRRIGEASYLRPSQTNGRVWLVAENDTNDSPGSTLAEVDTHGAVYRHATFANSFSVEPFAGEFLRPTQLADGSTGDDTELVDAHGRRQHLYRGRLVAVHGDTAVISQASEPCSRDCRLLVLTSNGGVRARTVTFDALPYLVEPALTPDGAQLFISNAVTEDGSLDRLTELDLTRGQRREVDDAWSARYYGPSMTFSPAGRWMFFTDATGRNVDAYDLTTRRAFRVLGSFATITQLAVYG